jgi:hypothetical protein
MLNPMLVSEPVTDKSGELPVAEFVIDISFTAEAVFTNLRYSFPESSAIALAVGN